MRRFDLDHVGAKIRKLQRKHVAGHEAREIEHAHAVQWSARVDVETNGAAGIHGIR
jgi:hypothetical protein